MVLATAPQPHQMPVSAPYSDYQRVCRERDEAIGRVKYLEQSVSRLQERITVLDGRLDERKAKIGWRSALHAVPTKVLGPSEKLVLEDLYAVFRGRDKHGCDPEMALGIQSRARKIGLSDATYRRSVETLAKIGTLELTKPRDEGTGRTRFLAKPTAAFWTPTTIARDVERDYGYRERRCPAHPTADIIKASMVHVARVTVTTTTTTYTCTECHKPVATETLRSEGKPQTQSSETTHTTISSDGEFTACPLREGPLLNQEKKQRASISPGEQRVHRPPLAAPEQLPAPEMTSAIHPDEHVVHCPSTPPSDPGSQVVHWPPEMLEPSTSIETLLLAIAGPDPSHLELLPTGMDKCTSHKEPVTRDHIHAMLAGTYSPGTTLRYPNGMTRALCLDADNSETKQVLVDAACKLNAAGASPLLESSPSIHHPDNVHLWIIFDQLVNAASAWATVIEVVPELSSWPERWPEKGTSIRLPGAYYRRPGVAGWCQLWRPGGMHRTEGAAFSLLLDSQTPACWVTASPSPVAEPVRRSALPRSTSSRWIPPTRPIQQGEQDTSLARYAMKMADTFGMSESDIYDELRRIADELCEQVPGDPLLDSSLWSKARSAVRKAGSARGSYDG